MSRCVPKQVRKPTILTIMSLFPLQNTVFICYNHIVKKVMHEDDANNREKFRCCVLTWKTWLLAQALRQCAYNYRAC